MLVRSALGPAASLADIVEATGPETDKVLRSWRQRVRGHHPGLPGSRRPARYWPHRDRQTAHITRITLRLHFHYPRRIGDA
ncbi:hypothetical protein Prubr_66860 [Polymorphospora rubra]|uniref:Transposase n=1 Tax=Polymorphospora rubra TaxID=338584 RepID=A0A810NEF3_9ACTN|nr:hypothetical protein Prubr_66860 [Polymorphospora rubra]